MASRARKAAVARTDPHPQQPELPNEHLTKFSAHGRARADFGLARGVRSQRARIRISLRKLGIDIAALV